jgi:hypothetical protein
MKQKKGYVVNFIFTMMLFLGAFVSLYIMVFSFNALDSLVEKTYKQEKELIILRDSLKDYESDVSLCMAYADLEKVQTTIRDNYMYYYINNKWISQDKLWESCLSK